jgi:hypothetical protein
MKSEQQNSRSSYDDLAYDHLKMSFTKLSNNSWKKNDNFSMVFFDYF